MNGGYGALTLLMGLWGDRQYTPVDSCANLLLLHVIKLNGLPIAVGTMLVDRRVAASTGGAAVKNRPYLFLPWPQVRCYVYLMHVAAQ